MSCDNENVDVSEKFYVSQPIANSGGVSVGVCEGGLLADSSETVNTANGLFVI